MLKREFSWSLSRKRIFDRCPRAYCYHYYGSWGGWDSYGSEKSKLLYRLKNMQDIDSWAETAFRKSLEAALNENRLSPEYLARSSCFHLRRDFISMKSPAYDKNPKNKLLKEYYRDRRELSSLCSLAEGRIAELVSLFEACGACRSLRGTAPLGRRSVPDPCCFIFNGVNVWTRPDFLWEDKGVLRIMNLLLDDPVETWDWAIKADLDVMLMREHSPSVRRIEVSSCFLGGHGVPELFYRSAESEVSSMIDKSVAEMLELTSLDTKISDDVFPKTRDSDKCSDCCFQQVCS